MECAGLYPESHGIVGNQFYDREVSFSSNFLQNIHNVSLSTPASYPYYHYPHLHPHYLALQNILIIIRTCKLSLLSLSGPPKHPYRHRQQSDFALKSPRLSLIDVIKTWAHGKVRSCSLCFFKTSQKQHLYALFFFRPNFFPAPVWYLAFVCWQVSVISVVVKTLTNKPHIPAGAWNDEK